MTRCARKAVFAISGKVGRGMERFVLPLVAPCGQCVPLQRAFWSPVREGGMHAQCGRKARNSIGVDVKFRCTFAAFGQGTPGDDSVFQPAERPDGYVFLRVSTVPVLADASQCTAGKTCPFAGVIAVVAVDGDAPFEFDVFNAEPGDAHEVGTVPVCRFEEGVRTGITAEGAGFAE